MPHRGRQALAVPLFAFLATFLARPTVDFRGFVPRDPAFFGRGLFARDGAFALDRASAMVSSTSQMA